MIIPFGSTFLCNFGAGHEHALSAAILRVWTGSGIVPEWFSAYGALELAFGLMFALLKRRLAFPGAKVKGLRLGGSQLHYLATVFAFLRDSLLVPPDPRTGDTTECSLFEL